MSVFQDLFNPGRWIYSTRVGGLIQSRSVDLLEMFFCPSKVMASNIFCPFWQDTVRFYDFLIAWMISVTRGIRISSSAKGGGVAGGGGGKAHPKIQCAYPKILIILFAAPIRVTMMIITTRSSLLCILDFVKKIVEYLSYNPDRSPVPGITVCPLCIFCANPKILII